MVSRELISVRVPVDERLQLSMPRRPLCQNECEWNLVQKVKFKKQTRMNGQQRTAAIER